MACSSRPQTLTILTSGFVHVHRTKQLFNLPLSTDVVCVSCGRRGADRPGSSTFILVLKSLARSETCSSLLLAVNPCGLVMDGMASS